MICVSDGSLGWVCTVKVRTSLLAHRGNDGKKIFGPILNYY